MLKIVGITHPGVREHNEDCFVASAQEGIGLVADGMGGYACGEVASALVQQTVIDALRHEVGLVEAIKRSHVAVQQAAADDESMRGMGSTVIALHMVENDYEIAWVGDSRAYLWDGELKQISRDHSYVESLLSRGAISPDEAVDHPNKNLITQAVGTNDLELLDVGYIQGRLQRDQQLLICSDGLVDEVTDSKIADILHQSTNSEAALDKLVEAALQNGGHDNITIVMAQTDQSLADSDQGVVPPVIQTTQMGGTSVRHSHAGEGTDQLDQQPGPRGEVPGSQSLEAGRLFQLRTNRSVIITGLFLVVAGTVLWKLLS